MNMHVFVNSQLTVIESNLDWAIPYWTRQKLRRQWDGVRITWRMK